jgi:phage head maturation protease
MTRQPPKAREPMFRLADLQTTGTARTIRFVASDETVDRYGDIIRASGWQLSNYAKNGPLLFAHDSRSPPIGTAKAWIDGTRLMADATFLEEGVSEFADEIWRITDAGALKASSVGFLPLDWKLIRGEPDENGYQPVTGYEFISQELLELSVVPVPANPAALALARSLALRPETTRALFVDEDRASARIAAAVRGRSIQLARLRVGHFNGGTSP